MSEITVFAEYGIEESEILSKVFSDDPSGLIKLRGVYSDLCESMKGSTSLTREDTERFKNEAKKNTKAQELSKRFGLDTLNSVYDLFEEDPDTLVLCIEQLEESLSLFKWELKEYVSTATKSNAEKVAEGKDINEKYEALAKVKLLLDSVWNLQKDHLKELIKADKEGEMFGENGAFPLKTSQKTGEIMMSLPRMPDKPGAAKKGGGRPVQSANLRLIWNGQDIPANVKGPEVCREYISDRRNGLNVIWKDVKTRLEGMKKDMSKDSWELEFPTGVLKGYIVKNDPVVSSGKKPADKK